jgi:predicted alpha/beta-hydrolase family hydrolase
MASVLLFPGAGSDSNQPSLRAIEAALATHRVVRADFPYRLAGRRAPDKAPVLMQAVRDQIAALPDDQPLFLGGRSMGGRMCSVVAAGADGNPAPPNLAGLVLICYPLHPPGKPDRLRIEHLPDIAVPTLFISGTKDTFATPEELTRWSATIQRAPVTHVWIDGKGHDLKGCDARIAETAAGFVTRLVDDPRG